MDGVEPEVYSTLVLPSAYFFCIFPMIKDRCKGGLDGGDKDVY